jgi:hypothetical protein
MKKKIKIIIIGSIALLVFFVWLGVIISQERERIMRERELLIRSGYALGMYFTISDCERGRMWSVTSEFVANRRNPNEVQYTKIVFVHSAEDAAEFGEYVLVAWPQENFQVDGEEGRIRGTQWGLDSLNEAIRLRRPDIDFRDYGLPENEITVKDTVDNWEIVFEFWNVYGRP